MRTRHILSSPDKIIIQKHGFEIRTLSYFSQTKNIYNRFHEGNNISSFLAPNTPFEEAVTGEVFHVGWDDFAPYFIKGYQDIGANHGSLFTFRLSMPRHWLTEKDIGRILTDEAGEKFIIVAIENCSDFLVHSLYHKESGISMFQREIKGKLSLDGQILPLTAIKQIQTPQRSAAQLSPHNRYNSFKIFADGVKEIQDGEIVECNFATLEMDVDLCTPDHWIDWIKTHPGKYTAPTDPRLKSFLNAQMNFEFQSRSVYTVKVKLTFNEDYPQSFLYGVLQSYGTTNYSTHEKFIPKLKPFLFADFYFYPQHIDLSTPYLIPEFPPISKVFTKQDCFDVSNPPDRYIDLFGNDNHRSLGIALGYSLTNGVTRKNSSERGEIVCYLPATKKIYPYALNLTEIKKDSSYTIWAYRQYFDPEVSKATACYGHWENGDYYLFADYNVNADEEIELLPLLKGKNIEIIEKYGDIEIPNQLPLSGKLHIKATSHSGFSIRFA